MNDRTFLSTVVVLGVIVLGICYATELNSNEAEARAFAEKTSDHLFSHYEKIVDEAFTDEQDPSYSFENSTKNTSNFLADIVQKSKKFDFKNFKDAELKHAFESIGKEAGLKVIGGERYWEIYDALDTLEAWSKGDYVEDYHSTDKLAYSSDVREAIKTSDDPDELEYYWKIWRDINAEWASDNLDIMLKGIKDAANLSDKSPLEFWMGRRNLTEMENLMVEIKPLYLELHAFLRDRLRKQYGESILRPNGLIPDHLFEQILAQDWLNGSIIENIFPLENLPNVESVMKKSFKSKDLYKIAENFYEKLGFEKYPDSVWGDTIKMQNTTDDQDECTVQIYYWIPKIRLEFCEKMNFSNFLQAYVHMGDIYYAKEMNGLPSYYFNTHDLEQAIGKAVILSASTHHNLKKIGMIPDDFDSTQEVEMNRLLRNSLESILYLPMDFIHAKVMADLLTDKVDLEGLNKHYWHLMDKYAGLGPPMGYGYNETSSDLPINFFFEMNENLMSRDFEMEILGYQIYKKLCELSGQYPKEPLHLCDIDGSKDAGNALKKMMRLGTSKPFHEVLASMFPENPAVKAESLLEYYSPLKKMLAEKNKDSNVKTGWKSSD